MSKFMHCFHDTHDSSKTSPYMDLNFSSTEITQLSFFLKGPAAQALCTFSPPLYSLSLMAAL